ncbi:MAG: hypothetical protein HQL66_12355 [Magnetococcales bacterium]|nr:hypothetical protein [Magnetococcales bacterium]
MAKSRVASLWQRFAAWWQDRLFAAGTFSLLFILVMVFLWPRIFITIHAGEAGVLYRRLAEGTVIDRVYEEGFWLLWPWNIMTVYDMRVQAIKHDFTVLSADGLPIHLMLLIRFQPEYATLAVLHQRVGPDYVNKIVVPTVESVMRRSIGRFRQEEIYQTKKGILASIVLLAIQEAGRKYVHMDDVIIRTIELPDSIQKAIEDKLVYEQQLAAYQFRLDKEAKEAQRKEVEATGIHKYHEIVGKTLDDKMLMWHGIEATKELAGSSNAKVIVIGSGKNGLPIVGSIPFDESTASTAKGVLPGRITKPPAATLGAPGAVTPKTPDAATGREQSPGTDAKSAEAVPSNVSTSKGADLPADEGGSKSEDEASGSVGKAKSTKRAKGSTPDSSGPNAKSTTNRGRD